MSAVMELGGIANRLFWIPFAVWALLPSLDITFRIFHNAGFQFFSSFTNNAAPGAFHYITLGLLVLFAILSIYGMIISRKQQPAESAEDEE